MDNMNDLFDSLYAWLIDVLPLSPFTEFFESVESLPYLNYINWIIPIGDMVNIGVAWLTSIGVFYLFMIVLRWVKAIR